MLHGTRRTAVLLLLAAFVIPVAAQEPPEESPATVPISSVNIQVNRGAGSTRVILTHSGSPTKAVLFNRGRIEIVYTDPIRAQPERAELDGPVLAGWLTEGDRRIVLLPGESYRRYESFDLRNPDRLILDLFGGEPADREGTVLPTPSRSQFVIVIDPGHGGVETGAVGGGGLKEKEITLDIARRLQKQLSGYSNVSVVLTRDEDQHLSLDDRTAIANHNRADLFLSIHANASPRRSAFGAETYYLSAEATDDQARTTAALENRSARRDVDGEASTLDLVLWDLAQNKYLAQSSRLAESVQKQMNQLTGTRDRGVRQAPFRVLMGATMPAILVEVGFISNPKEEEKLRTLGYRERVVEALANAIAGFMFDVKQVSAPASGPASTGN